MNMFAPLDRCSCGPLRLRRATRSRRESRNAFICLLPAFGDSVNNYYYLLVQHSHWDLNSGQWAPHAAAEDRNKEAQRARPFRPLLIHHSAQRDKCVYDFVIKQISSSFSAEIFISLTSGCAAGVDSRSPKKGQSAFLPLPRGRAARSCSPPGKLISAVRCAPAMIKQL